MGINRAIGGIAFVVVGVLGACHAEKNATGQWFGWFHILPAGGGPREDVAVVILKQQGDEVTGTLGPSKANQLPFKKGKINGKTIHIEMENNPIAFVLILDGDHLNGDQSSGPSGVNAPEVNGKAARTSRAVGRSLQSKPDRKDKEYPKGICIVRFQIHQTQRNRRCC